MKEEVKRWIELSDNDLGKAEVLFRNKYFDGAAFFSQQSVEKALKALIINKTNNFPKIHDLTQLARLNNAPKNIIEICAKLNPAYIVSRYPDSPKKYTEPESKHIIQNCKEVLKWIKKNLKS